MKIKCPACSKVLNIPESAAGKLVKCPCGKQLRAPGGSGASAAKPATAAPKPAAPKPAAAAPAANRPAAAPAGGLGGFDADMLDELTDQDLRPVKAVARAGRPIEQPDAKKGAAALQKHASEADRKAEMLISTGFAPLPPGLIFVAIINMLGSLFPLAMAMLVFGIMAVVPMADEDFEAGEGIAAVLVTTGFLVMGVVYFVSAICCFVRGKIPWYLVVCSYCFGILDASAWVIVQVVEDGFNFFMVNSLFRIAINIAIWCWIHGEDVRAFFGTDGESIAKVAIMNVIFFAVGAVLIVVPVFLG